MAEEKIELANAGLDRSQVRDAGMPRLTSKTFSVWGMVLRLAIAPSGLAPLRKKLAQPHQKCPSVNDKPRRGVLPKTEMHAMPPMEGK